MKTGRSEQVLSVLDPADLVLDTGSEVVRWEESGDTRSTRVSIPTINSSQKGFLTLIIDNVVAYRLQLSILTPKEEKLNSIQCMMNHPTFSKIEVKNTKQNTR